MRSREVRLARRPHGEPVPEDFESAEVDLSEPGEGRLLVRNVFMSVDPYYFDNVGGPQLEAVIGRLNNGGRIALCGSVSQYNATEPAPGPRNLALLVGKRGRMRGFIVSDHGDRDPDFRAEVGALIADGRLKLAETVVEGGIEAAPGAFTAMLRGEHLGKVVVRL